MIKLLFILFILFNISNVSGEILPYTDGSNKTSFILDYNESIDISLHPDNQIYGIEKSYIFGYTSIPDGLYYSNITFKILDTNITISESFNISNAGLLSKNVFYTLNIIESDIITSTQIIEYKVFKSTYTFCKSKFYFVDNELTINHIYTDIYGFNNQPYTLTLPQNLIMSSVMIENNLQSQSFMNLYIEYVYLGVKPKTYYINKLTPILRYPYSIIKTFDVNNNILNILLITSYILTSLFFWIKVLYQSFFTILLFILIGVIPFISYTQSMSQKGFIVKLFRNYTSFFQMGLNFTKYIIKLIIDLINLMPFI